MSKFYKIVFSAMIVVAVFYSVVAYANNEIEQEPRKETKQCIRYLPIGDPKYRMVVPVIIPCQQ